MSFDDLPTHTMIHTKPVEDWALVWSTLTSFPRVGSLRQQLGLVPAFPLLVLTRGAGMRAMS